MCRETDDIAHVIAVHVLVALTRFRKASQALGHPFIAIPVLPASLLALQLPHCGLLVSPTPAGAHPQPLHRSSLRLSQVLSERPLLSEAFPGHPVSNHSSKTLPGSPCLPNILSFSSEHSHPCVHLFYHLTVFLYLTPCLDG